MKDRQAILKSSTWYQYLLYTPVNIENKPLPLLLFLHGAGEKGDNPEIVKRHGPPRLIEEGKDFPAIVVSPQCPKKSYWNADYLRNLVEDVISAYKIDRSRIYITGISMGGYGTWAFASRFPDLPAAIVPICGGSDPETAYRLKDIPAWVFHGSKDTIVPVTESEKIVNALKKAGSKVKFTEYPDADHDSWTSTYNNPEVFSWLFEQKKTN